MKANRTHRHGIVTLILEVAVLISVILVASGSSYERSRTKNFDVYLGGGVSIPSGDLAELWKLGFHGTGRIGFSVVPRLDILFGVDFHRFGLDVPSGVTGVSGGDISTFQFTGGLKINLGVPVALANPYLIGGIGIGVVSFSDLVNQSIGTLSVDSQSRFLFEVGGGVEFSKIFIQGKIVIISPGDGSVTHFPVTLGVMI